jgi:hypothetical protein
LEVIGRDEIMLEIKIPPKPEKMLINAARTHHIAPTLFAGGRVHLCRMRISCFTKETALREKYTAK